MRLVCLFVVVLYGISYFWDIFDLVYIYIYICFFGVVYFIHISVPLARTSLDLPSPAVPTLNFRIAVPTCLDLPSPAASAVP